jgi:uncharacterized protein (TIGR02284 family)
MADDTIEQLKSLHNRAVDARKGYEEARDDADGRGLTPLFREMIALHETNAGELSAYLLRAGAPANQDGTVMSVVHRTIMDVRSFFNALGESVLPGLIDGEERNKSSYDRALEMPYFPADVRGVLTHQRDRIAGAIARMRSMKQTHASPTG